MDTARREPTARPNLRYSVIMTMNLDHSNPATYATPPLNVLYFGLSGAFSVPPLEALVDAGFAVRAVVLPALSSSGNTDATTPPYTCYDPPSPPLTARGRSLPLLTMQPSRTIMQIAAKHRIPVLEVARLRDPATQAALADYEPDILCVACFSRRIPVEILSLPRLGCLNVHPSLLPGNRGPDPLFWTFRHGETSTGVTIHQMDEGLDTGPIILQEHIEIPEGISEHALEIRCATLGGSLLVRAIHGLDAASISPLPQDETLASAYPWPTMEDYSITPDRPARWAYSFACGIAARTQPISIITTEHMFRLITPLGFDTSAKLTVPFVLNGDVLSIQCTPGVFHARIEVI